MLIKLGEAQDINTDSIRSYDQVSSDPFILKHFEKVASDLKAIAPRAKDFLYFTAIMMHAAEAALLDDNNIIRKDAGGNEITASWDDNWRWTCSDPKILPLKNANGDIFPESQLVKYHKDWVGKPLCLDHQSSSVDMIRGVIVDTYYDKVGKRVVSLCALDKINYPDLARKVETKYATCVSMGTGVENAICFDCGKIASRAEEFCAHMRNKTCYGEINIGLKPIELSIVVNGADRKAKIRCVVASANALAEYIDIKQLELQKSAFMHEMVEPSKISAIKKELESILNKLKSLEDTANKVEDIEEKEETGEIQQEKAASTDQQIQKMAADLNKIKSDMSKLLENNKEKNMTAKTAYFQGAGDVNEPTPGAVKYEKDKLNESLRENGDKHMLGQMDMGPIDGIHPGYSSFGETEEARKKRLLRANAENEKRSLRRQAAVEEAKKLLKDKQAYFQGAGGDNEPTPGKAKYKKEDYESYRDDEDKHMLGQAPFPGVGSLDGLYPSPASVTVKDELKRKQMLARAKLEGKFVKAAIPGSLELDKANSCWQVYADKKLILTATVDEITSGKSGMLYDSVASKEFGGNLLRTLRTEGYDKTMAVLNKRGQAMPAMPAQPAPAAPSMAPPANEMEDPLADVGGKEEVDDMGGTGDPSEQVSALVDKGETWLTDLRGALGPLLDSSENDLDELSELDAMEPKAASLNRMRTKVGKVVALGLKKAIAELTANVEELKELDYAYENKENLSGASVKRVDELAGMAIADINQTFANCKVVARSYVNYTNGVKGLLNKVAQVSPTKSKKPVFKSNKPAAPKAKKPLSYYDPLKGVDGKMVPMSQAEQDKQNRNPGMAHKAPMKKKGPKKPSTYTPGFMKRDPNKMTTEELMHQRGPGGRWDPDNTLERMLPQVAPAATGMNAAQKKNVSKGLSGKAPKLHKERGSLNQPADDQNHATATMPDGTKVEGLDGKDVKEMKAAKAPNLATKEGRTAYRAKLAQQGLKFSPILHDAHPEGSNDAGMVASNGFAEFKTLEDQHAECVQVAMAPVKVRKQAEDAAEIQRLVIKGTINPETDFPELEKAGVDPAAVQYWKKFYGQAGSEGSQFATELVKEHMGKKASDNQKAYEIKLARAYELTDDIVKAGLCPNNKEARKEQIADLMKMDESGFVSMARWVEKAGIKKQASIPQVGMMHTEEVLVAPPSNTSLQAELDSLWSGNSKLRNF